MSLLAQLDPFSATDGALPRSSRMDLSMEQRVGRPFLRGWGVGDVWKLGWLVAGKANHLASELIAHKVYGPRKPTWGVEMTIITSFLRDAGKHSSLADITFIRALTSLSSYLPPTTQTQITPLSFRVKSRGLRGLLSTFDSYELGGDNYDPTSEEGGFGAGRWLGGEWVVDKGLWKNWQREWKRSSSVPAQPPNGRGRPGSRKTSTDDNSRRLATPSPAFNSAMPASTSTLDLPTSSSPSTKRPRIILFAHGGAFYSFSASTHRSITAQLSLSTESRVFALNYRLSPETRFPGPLHDAVSAYLRLVEEEGVGEEGGPELLLAGDSAGGGLCLSLLMYLRDNGYPLPSGAILMSPWVDLTMSCDSWDSNAPFDIVPIPEPGDHLNPVLCYLGPEGAKKYLTHPYASPLFGDFHGLPPLLIQSGEAEVLRDEIMLLAHKATMQGVKVMHETFEDCVHVFQSFPFLPATKIAFNSQRDFVLRALPAFRAEEAAASASREALVSTSSTKEDDLRPRPLERSNTVSTLEEDEAITPSSSAPAFVGQFSTPEGSSGTPAVPPIPPQFLRSKSSTTAGGSTAPFATPSRPTLSSYRSSPSQPHISAAGASLLSLLQKTASDTGSACAPSAVPPMLPKGRCRSLSHPQVWDMINSFPESGKGEAYTVKRYAAPHDEPPAAASGDVPP